MAKYNPTVTTDKGEVLIAKLMAGDMGELEFTRIALSDKDYGDIDLAKLTSLEQIKQETLVSEKTRVDENNINVHGIIYNTDLLEGYNLKTIGLYATDPDEGEILYSVTTAIKADYVTEADEYNISSVILDLMTKISKAPVNMKGNPSALVSTSMLENFKTEMNENFEEMSTGVDEQVTELEENYNVFKEEIEEKFKNFCPFPVNSIFLSLDNSNPATLFLGTTWEKQEGRFLIGSSLDYPLGTTGGNSTITLTEANMPRHRHLVDSFSLTTAKHTHRVIPDNLKPYYGVTGGGGGRGWYQSGYPGDTGEGGGDNTGTASPYTSYIGSGTAFNNMPPYLVCNIWKRLT